MIRAAFSGLAGAWVARNVERGDIPRKLAVPLTLLATRLPMPVILAGAVGYGLYRLNMEARASRAMDVSPERAARPATRKTKPDPGRNRQRARKPERGAGSDV